MRQVETSDARSIAGSFLLLQSVQELKSFVVVIDSTLEHYLLRTKDNQVTTELAASWNWYALLIGGSQSRLIKSFHTWSHNIALVSTASMKWSQIKSNSLGNSLVPFAKEQRFLGEQQLWKAAEVSGRTRQTWLQVLAPMKSRQPARPVHPQRTASLVPAPPFCGSLLSFPSSPLAAVVLLCRFTADPFLHPAAFSFLFTIFKTGNTVNSPKWPECLQLSLSIRTTQPTVV